MELDLLHITEVLERNGHKLLYLCKFGSHLYGTNSPTSDEDYKGIFLPSLESCLLGTAPKCFSFNTKKDKDSKNTSEDIDVQLWSLQYFLNLLGQGETNAIDLLYSYSYPDMIVYDMTITHKQSNFTYSPMEFLLRNHKKLFSVKNTKSFIGYAIGQARKYGIKGSRLGVVKKILNVLDTLHTAYYSEVPDNWHRDKLKTWTDTLLAQCGDSSYCFVKTMDAKPTPKETLFVNGSQHHLDITMEEFYDRMKSEYEKYGERARQAETNEGIDFKALSHAVRAIRQMEYLLKDGEIKYPLACAEELKEIKSGKLTWSEIEKIITDGLEEVDRLQEAVVSDHILDKELVKNFILNCY